MPLSKKNNAEICVVESSIKNTICNKLLGVKIDQHLNFDDHVNSLCKKASGKLRTLARITRYIIVEKRKLIKIHFSMGNLNVDHNMDVTQSLS